MTVELVALDRLHKRAVFRVVGTMYALCLSLDERQKVPGCPEAEISPYDIQDQVCRVSIEAPQSIRINRGSHTYAKPVNGAQS